MKPPRNYPPSDQAPKHERAVRILLECILVSKDGYIKIYTCILLLAAKFISVTLKVYVKLSQLDKKKQIEPILV